MKKLSNIIIFASLLLYVGGCNLFNKEEELSSDEKINNWIYDEMSIYYYWLDELGSGANKSMNPGDFFNSILYSGDRFSWIQDNFIELLNSLQGVNTEAGYELKLYLESGGTGNVIGQIAYIKEGSPAAALDLKRGDLIRKINNTQITETNFRELLNNIKNTHSIEYERYNFDTESFESKGSITLNTVVFAENPHYLDTVYEINGKKIGYHVYNLFSAGTSGSAQYNIQMDQIYGDFKAAGIDELILDLRYNSGGAESATINLASLIGKEVNSSEVFVRREYNHIVEEALIRQNPGLDVLNRKFLDKAENIGSQLANGRVYILTSNRSASASELLINGLLPFMDVFIIGDITAGKNLGSITIYEEDDPENTWGMQPIVVKSFNKLDQSDYDTGFQPNVTLLDNSLIVYQLGDTRERLLNQALEEIGVGVVARVSHKELAFDRKMIYHSIDKKPYSNKMFLGDEDAEQLKQLFPKPH